jgi:thiol-disulfide isomerase/thioredoxin
MKFCLIVLGVACVLIGSPLVLSQTAEFVGQLDKELIPRRSFNMSIRFDPATEADKSVLPTPPGAGERVFVRRVKWPPGSGAPWLLMLIEPTDGKPLLYADLNLDGKLFDAERFPFAAFEASSGPEDDLILKLPFGFTKTVFQSYPVALRPNKIKGEGREVYYANTAYVTGVVDIAGQPTRVRYGIDPATGKADPAAEGLAMDTNGDGQFDLEPNSPETDYGNRGVAIFRVGQHYVSTKAVDTATGKLVLRSHPAAEYERIELTAGTELPDFTFTDFKGKSRKLSEFRGKYVLLDFWGTWCGPCVKEIPFLKELYAKFRTRNFEMIGMDNETGWEEPSAAELAKLIEQAQAFVTQKGIEWPQARTDSIDQLVKRRFRVRVYPLKLLLDPQGRILMRVSEENNQQLVERLDKLLPVTVPK